jgi:two-component system OmpR family sensor kinase
MFNRHSIFFKLNLLFVLALLMLALLFVFFRHNATLHELRQAGLRGMELGRLLHHTRGASAQQRAASLKEAQFELLAPQQLPPSARKLQAPKTGPERRRPFALYIDGDTYYFKSRLRYDDFLVRDNRPAEGFAGMHGLFLLLLAGLFALYLTLRRSLLPLKTLTLNIRRFARGDHDIDTSSERRDEIALISNEFNDAARKIEQLQSSRQLFLRNIIHELKTPLTRGKLALAMMEESKEIRYLDQLFNRMDDLINQFARIEKLQSSNLERESSSVVSLLNEAIEHLYLERPREDVIALKIEEEAEILVDRELFASVLSNLLDNAIKYASKLPVTVRVDKTRLCIENRGEPLSQEIETCLQPFTGGHENSGLGLGLYIADTLIQAHGFRLEYRYKEGTHRFCILFAGT